MRMFVAADVNDEVRAWAGRARRAVEQRKPALGRALRWVQPQQVHVTLRFLGETDRGRAARLVQALGPGVPVAPFTFSLDAIDWFPPRGRPRVLVTTIGDGAAQVHALKRALDEALARAIDVGPEDREFVAHLTLARVRDQEAAAVASMRRDLPGVVGSVPALSVTLDHATLYQSELSPAGARYSVVATVPLAGSRA
jgi:2'-5' RNA ligase